MIRLIVMYNLAEHASESEFLDWRLGAHQSSNAALPEVLRTDFGRVIRAWPDDVEPRFRFVTVVEWPDMASFEAAFYAPDVQSGLRRNLERLAEFEYNFAEILTSSDTVGVSSE